METLRLQMDNLQLELQQLRVENARLHEENARLRDKRPEVVAELDATLDAERLKLENGNLQDELQELRRDLHESREREARAVEKAREQTAALERQLAELEMDETTQMREAVERLSARCEELEACCNRWEREAEQERSRAELERYRALEVERQKWEACEERLLEQLRKVEGQEIAHSPVQDPDKLSDAGEAGGESDKGRNIPVVPRAETPKNEKLRSRKARQDERRR